MSNVWKNVMPAAAPQAEQEPLYLHPDQSAEIERLKDQIEIEQSYGRDWRKLYDELQEKNYALREQVRVLSEVTRSPDAVLVPSKKLAEMQARIAELERQQGELMVECEAVVAQAYKSLSREKMYEVITSLEIVLAAVKPTEESDCPRCSGTIMHGGNIAAFKSCRECNPSAVKPAVCKTCNGHGMVGGYVGQTAESFGYESEPCPACATVKPARQEGGAS